MAGPGDVLLHEIGAAMTVPDVVKFQIGETVYCKLSPEEPKLVTGILFRQNCVIYKITWSNGSETNHYDFELTRDKAYKPEVEE